MSEEDTFIRPPEFATELPKPIKRPCDYGLEIAIGQLETQLGTIEAYNRLVAAAVILKGLIDDKKAKAPATMFLTDPCFAKDVDA